MYITLWQSVRGDSEQGLYFGYSLKMEAFRSELLAGHVGACNTFDHYFWPKYIL